MLPDSRLRFVRLLAMLRDDDQPGFVLAELNDLLSGLTSGELCSAVEHADLSGLTPYLRNYLAAMVELAAHQRDIPPSAWVRDIEPLETPHFAPPDGSAVAPAEGGAGRFQTPQHLHRLLARRSRVTMAGEAGKADARVA